MTIKNYFALLMVLAVFEACATNKTEEKPSKPNIVFILADDLGYGDISCYNENSKIKTPFISSFFILLNNRPIPS